MVGVGMIRGDGETVRRARDSGWWKRNTQSVDKKRESGGERRREEEEKLGLAPLHPSLWYEAPSPN